MAGAFGVNLLGMDKFRTSMKAIEVSLINSQKDAMQEAILLIHETAVKSIQANTDGRAELRYDPKRTVAVSHPGDPPNTDTGRLVQSIQMAFKNGGLIGRVGSNLRYAAWLEFGTKRMQARPWLQPAIAMVSGMLGAIFKKAANKAIKENAK